MVTWSRHCAPAAELQAAREAAAARLGGEAYDVDNEDSDSEWEDDEVMLSRCQLSCGWW